MANRTRRMRHAIARPRADPTSVQPRFAEAPNGDGKDRTIHASSKGLSALASGGSSACEGALQRWWEIVQHTAGAVTVEGGVHSCRRQ